MEQSVGAISSSSDFTLDQKLFPSNYELQQSLGEGGFGKVVQCFKKDTNETVAVKIFKYGCDYRKEMMILRVFRERKLEECNIVKFIDSFRLMNDEVALAFEKLDITLKDYIAVHRNFAPMELCDIRSVVQQLAIALDALKTNGLIHTDIKIDNIMLVDREAQPLKVKLIDFGLALPTRWATRKNAPLQTLSFRAPEIFLGLPFSEAIDMWSTGVVMSIMMLASVLFRGNDNYDVMRWIVAFRGVPPDHLLDAATKSKQYFIKDASGHWRLKTPQEYWQRTTVTGGYRPLNFNGMDILEELSLENLTKVGVDEKRELIDLLKAMLQIDPKDRITPCQVLTHPFITRGTVHKTSDTSESPEAPSVSSGVIHVRPTSRTCILALELKEEVEPKTSLRATDGLHTSTSETLPPGVIMVKPASPECRLSGIADSRQSESCLLDCPENVSENPPVEPTPLSTEGEHPGVIMVKPAPPECRLWGIDGSERSESRPLDCPENVSENPPVEPTPLSTEGEHPGVIMVKPAPPECRLWGIDGSGRSESRPLDCPENVSENPPVEPTPLSTEGEHPGVIMVKPAPPECRLWGIDGSERSESRPLDCPENVPENPPVEPTPLSTEDVEQELSDTASDCATPKKKEKRKRKRNCFKRFLAWTKRTFCCCIPANDDD